MANPADQQTKPSDLIQLHTFTKWCNKHLKPQDHVDNLLSDMRDGLKLKALVEALSNKKIILKKRESQQYIKDIHCLDNVSVVLTFLKETEKIDLVNIGK